MQAPGDLYSEIAPKFKIKQRKVDSDTKLFAFPKELLRVPNDGSQKVSQYITICVVHSSV